MKVPQLCGECSSFVHTPTPMNPYGGGCSYWSAKRMGGFANALTLVQADMVACTHGLLSDTRHVKRVQATIKVTKKKGGYKSPVDKVKLKFDKLSLQEKMELINSLKGKRHE